MKNERIKLYACFTPSHAILKNEFFLPSLGNEFEVILDKYKQECPTGKYLEKGWNKAVANKANTIIKAIKENWNKIFIFSDVDIQFFSLNKQIILECIKDKDIVFQKDSITGTLCTGFFVCRGNKKTLKLWQTIKKRLKEEKVVDDQLELNSCFRNEKSPYNLKWGYLPRKFFSPGLSPNIGPNLWKPGVKLLIPKSIVMHHANWTRGIKNKVLQFEYIRKLVNNGKYYSSWKYTLLSSKCKIMKSIDKNLGRFGLFLKKHRPKLYYVLKGIKK